MAEKPKLTPQEARLKEIAVLERLAVLYGEVARDEGGAPFERPLNVHPAADVAPEGLASLPLMDAIYEFLKTTKVPYKPKRIWKALEAAGCEVQSSDPTESVMWALKKLAKQNPDVVKMGCGTWDLRSKYTKGKFEKLLAKQGGRGGRTTEDHAARTKAGMEKRRAAGKRIGAAKRFTADHIAKFKASRDAGRSILASCRDAGFSAAFYQLHREFIDAWKFGDPWPMPGDPQYEPENPETNWVDILSGRETPDKKLRVVK